MADLARMIESARRAMVNVLDLEPVDRVLVVQDPRCGRCPEAFAAAARAVGCRTTTYDLPRSEHPLTTLPDGMAVLLDGQDVVINVMSGASDEIPFRVAWLRLIEERGLRIGHSPGIHEDMLDGGPMDVDYALMAEQAHRLIDALEGATFATITAPGGTDITLELRGRQFVTDARVSAAAKGCNLPCGEVYGAPVEDGAEGVVVADGSIGGEGPPPSPVRLEVRAGRVVGVHCAAAAWQRRITQLLDTDAGARTIAELGIGLNPKARLVGLMLEDEKAYRTAHVAFGCNIGMPGGVSKSSTHVDYLIHRPTIIARYENATERVLVDDGDLQGS